MPNNGPNSGRTTVTLQGYGFLDTKEIKVLFRNAAAGIDLLVPATYIDPFTLSCNTSDAGNYTGQVLLSVALNGVDFTASLVTYLYYGVFVLLWAYID